MRKKIRLCVELVTATVLLLTAAVPYTQESRARGRVVVSVIRPENGERDPALEQVVGDALSDELRRVGFRVVSFRAGSYPLRLVGGDEKYPRVTDVLTLANASGADYAIIGLYAYRDEEVRIRFGWYRPRAGGAPTWVSESGLVDLTFDDRVAGAVRSLLEEENFAPVLEMAEAEDAEEPAEPERGDALQGEGPAIAAAPQPESPPAPETTPETPVPAAPEADGRTDGEGDEDPAAESGSAEPAGEPEEPEADAGLGSEDEPAIEEGPEIAAVPPDRQRPEPPQPDAPRPVLPEPAEPSRPPAEPARPRPEPGVQLAPAARPFAAYAGTSSIIAVGKASDYFTAALQPVLAVYYRFDIPWGRLGVGPFGGYSAFRTEGVLAEADTVLAPFGVSVRLNTAEEAPMSFTGYLNAGGAVFSLDPNDTGRLSKVVPFASAGAGLLFNVNDVFAAVLDAGFAAYFDESDPIFGISPSLYAVVRF